MTMKLPRPDKSRRTGHGQLIVLFAMTLPVLILFVGLAIDFGFAFVEKTSLSKAVDAAALAGMRNIDAKAGGPTPTQYALSAFNTNYGTELGRDINPPVVNVAFSTNANNNTVVNVSATATIYTSFLRLLPGFERVEGQFYVPSNAPSADYVVGTRQVGIYDYERRGAGAPPRGH